MRERTFGTVLFNIERLALLGSVLAIASLAAGCGLPAAAPLQMPSRAPRGRRRRRSASRLRCSAP